VNNVDEKVVYHCHLPGRLALKWQAYNKLKFASFYKETFPTAVSKPTSKSLVRQLGSWVQNRLMSLGQVIGGYAMEKQKAIVRLLQPLLLYTVVSLGLLVFSDFVATIVVVSVLGVFAGYLGYDEYITCVNKSARTPSSTPGATTPRKTGGAVLGTESGSSDSAFIDLEIGNAPLLGPMVAGTGGVGGGDRKESAPSLTTDQVSTTRNTTIRRSISSSVKGESKTKSKAHSSGHRHGHKRKHKNSSHKQKRSRRGDDSDEREPVKSKGGTGTMEIPEMSAPATVVSTTILEGIELAPGTQQNAAIVSKPEYVKPLTASVELTADALATATATAPGHIGTENQSDSEKSDHSIRRRASEVLAMTMPWSSRRGGDSDGAEASVNDYAISSDEEDSV